MISVIVPCYNSVDCIDRCVGSIVNQTIGVENLEIILVNDASTDDTLDYLQKWEQKYPDQVLVITYEKNIRQGGARNVGLRYATGEYIAFVDSDDWLEPDAIEVLYNVMRSGDYEFVQGKCAFASKYELCENLDRKKEAIIEYQFETKQGFTIWTLPDRPDTGIWSGLYKRNIIIENEIYFPEGYAYEDNYWASVVKIFVKSYCFLDSVIYHYYQNPVSTVHQVNAAHHLDRLKVEILLLEYYKKVGAFDVLYETICNDFVKRFYLNTFYVVFTRYTYVPDIYTSMRKAIEVFFPDYLKQVDRSNKTNAELLLLDLLPKYEELNVRQMEEVRNAYLDIIRISG